MPKEKFKIVELKVPCYGRNPNPTAENSPQ
jgi:hypothetical protein